MSELIRPGDQVNNFKILRAIGRGGMGRVYEAVDENLKRRVALKFLSVDLANDPEMVKRFQTEGMALAKIVHQHTVTVYSVGEHQGIPYIAMQYIEGKDLHDFIKEKFPIALDEVFNYWVQMLDGVMQLHDKHIIHRDLKPKNMIVDTSGVLKIVDFGIAKMMQDEEHELTQVGTVLGSLNYIAPEIARGEPATIQTDIRSLGIIFYEMLVGRVPFKSNNRIEVLKKIDGEDIAFPKRVEGKIPLRIKQIIFRMCERSLHLRYKTVKEVKKDLLSWDENRDAETSITPEAGDNYTSSPDPSFSSVAHQSSNRGRAISVSGSGKVHNYPSHSSDRSTRVSRSYKKNKSASQNKIFLGLGVLLLAVSGYFLFNHRQSKGIDSARVNEYSNGFISPTQLITPVDKQIIESESSDIAASMNVDFQWISGLETADHSLEIATDPEFINIVYYNSSKERSEKGVALKPNIYYWRITTKENQQASAHSTEVYSFEVVPKRVLSGDRDVASVDEPLPPQSSLVESPVQVNTLPKSPSASKVKKSHRLSPPKITAGIETSLVGSDTEISWSRISKADYYELEISKDKKFRGKKAYRLNTRATKVEWAPEETGKYYYRVKAINRAGVDSRFSSPMGLTVNTIQLKLRVKKRFDIMVNSPSSLTNTQSIPVSWNKTSAAESYSIVTSKDKGFRNLLGEYKTKSNRANVEIPTSVPVYMKVAALNNDGKVIGDYSEPSRVYINLDLDIKPPALVSPSNAVRIHPSSKNTLFEWSSPEHANAFEVQFARDRKFKSIIDTYSTLIPKYLMKNPWEVGKYYWRVRAKHNKHNSHWSSPGIFFIKP